MLQDFPASGPPASAPDPPASDGPDPLLRTYRLLWWLVPGALLAWDLFFIVLWHGLFGRFVSGSFGTAMALLPWFLHTGLILGFIGFLWARRVWPPGVRTGLLAAAALPFLRFGIGQVLAMGGLYRAGELAFYFQAALSPILSVALAVFAVSLRRGGSTEAKASASAGVMAVAAAAAVSGGWVVWALLPSLSRLAGDDFAEEAADPRAAMGSPTPTSLMTAGWGGLVSAFAMVIVPLIGLLKFRGSFGPVYLVDGLALLIGCLTWTILGARWAKGRTEGRVLRVLTWIALVLPVLLAGAIVLLLLVLGKSRLF